MSETTRWLADNLVAARTKKGISQRKLAKMSGVDHSSISRLELGGRMPEIETLRALADALDTEPMALLDPPKKRKRAA